MADLRLLGLDTSDSLGQVIARNGKQDVQNLVEGPCEEGLLPVIEKTLQDCDLCAHDLDAIALGLGPGGFTSTRVGVSSAKALAYGLGIPIVGCDSMMLCAAHLHLQQSPVFVLMRGGRLHINVGVYQVQEERWQCLLPPERHSNHRTLVERLRAFAQPICHAVGSMLEDKTTLNTLGQALPSCILHPEIKNSSMTALLEHAQHSLDTNHPSLIPIAAVEPIYLSPAVG